MKTFKGNSAHFLHKWLLKNKITHQVVKEIFTEEYFMTDSLHKKYEKIYAVVFHIS